LAERVSDEMVSEEPEVLEELILRIFEVMHRAGKLSCDYAKRGMWSSSRFDNLLIIAARTSGGPACPEMIGEMERELKEVTEYFHSVVSVEGLRLAIETSKLSFLDLPIVDPQGFIVEQTEQELLHSHLKPVETGYHRDLGCMEGTRESLLNQIVAWVANISGQENAPQKHVYWLYGPHGIGKTSMAHSICTSLHERGYLAGAFFCRRDDPNLSEPRNILPTFINKLAILSPHFRTIVANHLRDDPHLSPESMADTLFPDFMRSLPRHPEHTLVFVIDALDECGDPRSRSSLLKALTNAAVHVPWLKIIITSRTEADIRYFFDTLTQSTYLSYDLATDRAASADLRTFALHQFDLVASVWHLNTPWPKESDFNRVISRANGLFLFIKTLVLALERCEDPEETLRGAMQHSGFECLFELYSNILREQIRYNKSEFQQMIGVLLASSPYRALSDGTIAELVGVKPSLVKWWVDALSPLLYRDEAANRGVRVRHLSVYDYFVSNHSHYQVNVRDADVHLGLACLKTMVSQLRFNICKLEDSRLANADVKDLPSRVKENISEPLQYCCLYWSSHLRLLPDNYNQRALVLGSLKSFFEGLYPLFWLEVLSVLEMVPIGAPSLRRLLSCIRVSTCPAYC